MHFSFALAALPALAAAAPFSFPLSDGFPNPSKASQAKIATVAGGSLPDAPPPPSLNQSSLDALKLIAFNEIFEVAFFTELLYNVTHEVSGYEIPAGGYNGHAPLVKEEVIAVIGRIQAQEQMHALNANGVLKHFGQKEIEPCQYQFSVNSLNEAVAFANTFTDIVLGVLPDAQQVVAESGDAGLVHAIGSIIGQEGEQNGVFRLVQGKLPSAAPFLGAANPDFAFTAIQQNVVPGSCPNIGSIPFKTFQPLTLEDNKVKATKSVLHFSWKAGKEPKAITYISGQNTPVVVPFTKDSTKDGVVHVHAEFPFDLNNGFADGLTIAAATDSEGPFADADAVAKATCFGPAPIEVS
ncbi:MAG: hypothetical protein M1828_000641 [Chrysothrix sp. TS-e1954]|nr:MAG: hypothetical protein M1828_000641 [Chrysothrix sp. TS-e1954]